jgi:transposase
MIKVQCCICGNDIERYPSQVRVNNYCSVQCRDGEAEKHRAEITKLLKTNTILQASKKIGIPENTILCWLQRWRKKGIHVKCAMQYKNRAKPKSEKPAPELPAPSPAREKPAKHLSQSHGKPPKKEPTKFKTREPVPMNAPEYKWVKRSNGTYAHVKVSS